MRVLLYFKLNTSGGHLILHNLNIIQYKLLSPNPTSLYFEIPYTHCPSPAPSSAHILVPTPSTPYNTHTRAMPCPQGKDNTIQNNFQDPYPIILPGWNLRTCCTSCHKPKTGAQNGGLSLEGENSSLCLLLQLIGFCNGDSWNWYYHQKISDYDCQQVYTF